MSDLAAASARLGIPEHILERSAAARAEAEGISSDELLRAWAGGSAAPSGTGAVSPTATPVEQTEVTVTDPSSVSEAVPEVEPAPVVITGAPAEPVRHPPAPEAVTVGEAHRYEAVITSPTAGLAERTATALPKWLAILFFAVPLIGLTYLISFAAGPECGTGGQLGVDRLTGLVENCDGSEFEVGGAAGGVDVRALISEGGALYAAPSSCASCHGGSGEGGSGPALAGAILSTFSMCSDHVDWVSSGTNGFLEAGLTTYGDAGTTVGSGGVMPSFEDTFSPEEIAKVVFYERVVLGGQDVDEAVFDCGFAEDEASDDGDLATSEEESA